MPSPRLFRENDKGRQNKAEDQAPHGQQLLHPQKTLSLQKAGSQKYCGGQDPSSQARGGGRQTLPEDAAAPGQQGQKGQVPQGQNSAQGGLAPAEEARDACALQYL